MKILQNGDLEMQFGYMSVYSVYLEKFVQKVFCYRKKLFVFFSYGESFCQGSKERVEVSNMVESGVLVRTMMNLYESAKTTLTADCEL